MILFLGFTYTLLLMRYIEYKVGYSTCSEPATDHTVSVVSDITVLILCGMWYRNLNQENAERAAIVEADIFLKDDQSCVAAQVRPSGTLSKRKISRNHVLTNSTKALVYGRTEKVSLVSVQGSRTMGSILGQNTFGFSPPIMDADRSSQKTFISEEMMARGRPLCPTLQFYPSFMACYAKNVESGLTLSAPRAEERQTAN